ncbi:MAG: hypothetical protein AB7L28_08505 [Kofleriaceae bacterium]
MRTVSTLLVFALTFVVGCESPNDSDDQATSAVLVPPLRIGGVLGSYASYVTTEGAVSSAGPIDIPATMARLTAAKINTFAYLIYTSSQSKWNTLPAVLDAAHANGIKVWVYLVPPSETPDAGGAPNYPPFQEDYVAWAEAIATLATTKPALQAFVIDDFGYNTPYPAGDAFTLFTPGYTQQIVEAAHAIQPSLAFIPILYFEQIGDPASTQYLVDLYGPYFDGVIWPYHGGTNWASRDFTNTALFAPQLKIARANLSNKPGIPSDKEGGTSHKRGAYEIRFPWHQSSTTGSYALVARTATIATPKPTTFELGLWISDDYGGATSGYHTKQVVVDNTVVWEDDVAGDEGGEVIGDREWQFVRPDPQAITAALTNRPAGATITIQLRVFDKAGVGNFGVGVRFDEITAAGMTVNNASMEADDYTKVRVPEPSAWQITHLTGTKDLPLYVMIYANPGTGGTATTSAYVNTLLGQALRLSTEGYADGVMPYVPPIYTTDPKYIAMQTHYSSWTPTYAGRLRLSYPWGLAGTAGHFAEMAQTATVTGSGANAEIGFWTTDSFNAATSGYLFRQLVIDGVVVWEEDVAGNEGFLDRGLGSQRLPAWRYHLIRVGPYVQGKTHAEIAFRVYMKRGVTNFGVNVELDEVRAAGGLTLANPSFNSDDGSWTFRASGAGWTRTFVP